jgi:tetratricopeptide (TPR) repeat protein
MGHCNVCGIEQKFPFECSFCGRTFCSAHKFPEDHACPAKNQYKKENHSHNQQNPAKQPAQSPVNSAPQANPTVKPEVKAEQKTKNYLGNYVLNREIGRGGFGIVYLVNHPVLGDLVLKTLKAEYMNDSETKQLFQKEANIWVNLEHHQNIVQAHFLDRIDNQLYIAMEYIEPNPQGLNTLEGYLQNTKLDLPQALHWAVQFCYGMEHAYSKGVRCHRDIKPANIMVTKEKKLKITDFGIAGVINPSGLNLNLPSSVQQNRTGLPFSTLTGKIAGTPWYMSPEQFINVAKCDQRSDIYSFGIILYEMATNIDGKRHPPFFAFPKDGSFEEQKRLFLEMRFLHHNAAVPKIHSKLFPIICRCLEKDPNKRYSSFVELRNDLERLLKAETGESVNAPAAKDSLLSTKAVNLYLLGHVTEALDCLNKALEINPNDSNAWLNKATMLNDMRKPREALQCIDKALEIDPKDPSGWITKANCLRSFNRLPEALECLNKALEIEPNNATAWNNKANCLNELGRFDEAVYCANKALELTPADVENMVTKGNSLNQLGRFNEALKCLDEAIRISPHNPAAWNNKGHSLSGLNRFAEALECLNKVLELSPKYVTGWLNKAHCLSDMGRFEESNNSYDEALNFSPFNMLALIGKAVNLETWGHFQEAIDCCNKILSYNPINADAWTTKGNNLNRLGNISEAIECYRRALQINPRHEVAQNNLKVLTNRSNQNEALERLTKESQTNPRDPKVWINKGLLEESLGKKSEAIASYRKFIELAEYQYQYREFVDAVCERIRNLEKYLGHSLSW